MLFPCRGVEESTNPALCVKQGDSAPKESHVQRGASSHVMGRTARRAGGAPLPRERKTLCDTDTNLHMRLPDIQVRDRLAKPGMSLHCDYHGTAS